MSDVDLAQMIGRLEGKIDSRFDEHGKALKSVADEVQKQGRRLDDLEKDREANRKIARQSAHDLSEHMAGDASALDGIKRHMATVDKSMLELKAATQGQDVVLGKQTKTLGRIDKLHPIIILAAAAIGAAISGYQAARVIPPPAPDSAIHR